MRVFVSWSGEASHDVAKALKEWLPVVIQDVEVFLSSDDIYKGTQWFNELSAVLQASDFGILCLTRDNLSAPWVLFEAGAIAKHLATSRIIPLLIGLKVEDLKGPLAQFNAAGLDREEIKKLFSAVNEQLGTKRLAESRLEKALDNAWSKLEDAFEKAKAKTKEPSVRYIYDVFMSAPMAAFETDDEYKQAHGQFKTVFDVLKRDCEFAVYWAAENIDSKENFDVIDVSVEDDLKAIEHSRYFLLILPKKVASSVLFEAGYAFALRRRSHYFVNSRADLPFLMRELPGTLATVRIHDAEDWNGYHDLAQKIKRYKDTWFPK